MSSPTELWLYNGKLGAGFSVRDRALAYGDGLFETLLLKSAVCPFAELHWRRLIKGCSALAIPLEENRIAGEYQQFIAELGNRNLTNGVVKLIVSRGEGGRGYRPNSTQANTFWQFRELSNTERESREGVALAVSTVRLASQPLLAGLKHLNRLENVLAAVQAEEGFEPLLLDAQGLVIETLSHNIFAVFDGKVCTPKLEQCGVSGVLRQWLMNEGSTIHFPVVEKEISLATLLSADEIFMGNSVRGFWPVKEVSGQQFDDWPVCKKIQAHHQAFIESFSNV